MTPDPAEPPGTDPQKTSPAASERQRPEWDIQNAPKNYGVLLLAHGATALLSLATVWLVTKYLGPGGYGGIIAFVAASQLAQIFLNWSSTALVRFGIEEFVETGKITRSFWSRSLIFVPNVLFIVALSAFWLPPVAGWLGMPAGAIWLVAAHLTASSLWLHVQYALQGVKMLRLQGALLAVERVLILVGVVMLIATGRLSWENALWCYIVPPLVLAIAGLFLLKPFVELRRMFDREQARKMLVFSVPLIPFAIVGYLSTSQLDAFFITRYLSTRDLGIYAVAAQINGMAMQLPIMANTILLSMFVSLRTGGQESLLQRFFKDAVPSLTLFWSAACMVLAALGSLVIPLVFGSEFSPASPVLWVLTASSVAAFPVLMGLATLSNAYSKTYISMYASCATAAANVLFNLLLIPRYGIVGCAWATVLSGVTNLTLFYILLRREGLIAGNWVYISIAPILLSALAIALGTGAAAAAAIFVLAAIFVAYLYSDSVRYAISVLRNRLNVKDVPPEPSLR